MCMHGPYLLMQPSCVRKHCLHAPLSWTNGFLFHFAASLKDRMHAGGPQMIGREMNDIKQTEHKQHKDDRKTTANSPCTHYMVFGLQTILDSLVMDCQNAFQLIFPSILYSLVCFHLQDCLILDLVAGVVALDYYIMRYWHKQTFINWFISNDNFHLILLIVLHRIASAKT